MEESGMHVVQDMADNGLRFYRYGTSTWGHRNLAFNGVVYHMVYY
jgi:hypothetical protein